MKKMSRRERVLTAVEHKEPDRVPINFGGELCTGIVESIPEGRIYSCLCQSLGFYDRPEPITTEFLNIVVNIDRRVLKKLGSDIVFVLPGAPAARVETDGSKTWDKFFGSF